jgi:hypothetical protein
MAEEEQYETPLELYRSGVRELIDTQYNKWKSLNRLKGKDLHKAINNLLDYNDVNDFIAFCNFLKKEEQQTYLDREDESNTFREFLTFLFQHIQPNKYFCQKIIELELNDITTKLIVQTKEGIRTLKFNIDYYLEKKDLEASKKEQNKRERLITDMVFLESREKILSGLLQPSADKSDYISDNPILNFSFELKKIPEKVKSDLMEVVRDLPLDLVKLTAIYSEPTHLKVGDELPNKKRRRSQDDSAEAYPHGFSRTKSKKPSRNKSRKGSRRKSKKASRRKSKKPSRRKSKKPSRRKFKKSR